MTRLTNTKTSSENMKAIIIIKITCMVQFKKKMMMIQNNDTKFLDVTKFLSFQ